MIIFENFNIYLSYTLRYIINRFNKMFLSVFPIDESFTLNTCKIYSRIFIFPKIEDISF